MPDMNNLKQYLKLDPKWLGSINSVKFNNFRPGKRRMEITAQMAGQYCYVQCWVWRLCVRKFVSSAVDGGVLGERDHARCWFSGCSGCMCKLHCFDLNE